MLKNTLLRTVGLGVAALLTVGAATLGAGAALAAPTPGTGNGGNGLLTFNPASAATQGNLKYPTFTTNGGCSASSNAYQVVVTGPGVFGTQPSPILVIANSTQGFSSSAAFTSAASENAILDLQQALGGASSTNLAGEYDYTLNCIDSFTQQVFSTFTGALYFSTPTAYSSTDPNSTTTVVAATQAAGTTKVNATATVTGAGTPTGTVQFKVDGVNSGAPVALVSGVATYQTPSLSAPASHAITANYLPTGAYSASTGNTVNVNVTGVSTVVLTSNAGATVTPNTAIVLTAATGPAGTAGAVDFKRNGVVIPTCAAVAVASNSAQCTYTPTAAETDNFTAVFTPTLVTIGSSTSNTVSVSVSSASATEDIVTKITAQGSLVISVNGCTYASGALSPADGPAVGPLAGASGTVGSTNNTINPCNDVVLPSPTLNGSGQLLVTAGTLKPVTITDTRVPDAPWSFTGQVDDFADFGGAHTLPGSGLGWTPNVIGSNVNNTTIVAGPTVAGDVGPITFSTTGGLKTARAFAYTSANPGTAGTSAAPTGSGLGITQVGGALTLNVPTNSVPGVYVAHLTLTAI